MRAFVGNCVYLCDFCVMNNCTYVLFPDFSVKHFEFDLYLYIKFAYVWLYCCCSGSTCYVVVQCALKLCYKQLSEYFGISCVFNVHEAYLTSHLSTTGCCTQSELFPAAAAFWPSLSPVPSSEWVRLWLPWWLPWGRRADGLLGGRLSSRRRAWFSSSTARTRSSRACRSPTPPASAGDWASNGESGRGLTAA